MYNPDQRYESHKLYLHDLQEQHTRYVVAVCAPRRGRAIARRASRRMGTFLMALGAWLEQSAQRGEQVT